ncbi:MAG: hypothetical protein BWY99_02827 [Synergistetes bacterium ADurb.BinA166]|nr:MAG: hypothetical protein BWY99_02827 [Synergistetes bacterium ADurb.BinA166]
MVARPVGDEGDQLVPGVDHVRDPVGPVLAPHGVEDAARLPVVVDPGLVPPAVGGEQERRDEVELPVRGRAFRIVLPRLRLHAPGEIGVPRPPLVLHVLLRPAPEPVEHLLPVELHRHHHAVGEPLGAGVVVFQVGDVGHVVADREVDPVLPQEEVVVRLGELDVDGGLGIARFAEDVAVFPGFPRPLLPRLHLSAGVRDVLGALFIDTPGRAAGEEENQDCGADRFFHGWYFNMGTVTTVPLPDFSP